MKHGKKYNEAAKLIDRATLSPLANTKTLTVLPVPLGNTTAPRICCSA